MIDDLYKKIKSNYKEKMTDLISSNPEAESVKAVFNDYFLRQMGLDDDEEDQNVMQEHEISNGTMPRISEISRRSK